MVHFLAFVTHRQCLAIPFALITGLTTSMVLISAPQAIANDFESCASRLIEAGVAGPAAAGACGQALHPIDLASCTVDVIGVAEVDAEQALVACQSDRRPQDLATCIGDIHQGLEVANSTAVLNNCRRSVLPVRFSDCVVGVATAADLAVADSMTQCIAAGYRPEDVAPTFIFSR
ncbi:MULTISPECIES: hypothetical protein [Cyanophyceae]|uniref:hypothetical protein n=2 Tax=Cyanobacteriota TaxID=1117 RepID=UPI001685A66C|nr:MULTISPECIES: hypothetical protein [Cyanophyceae]MBD1915558.1 hypothetical protein [Phormidium sp. FACHB-77]MBD2050618.1 hypothetical protein [Leptolyngbya sp. FACHB-60]